MVLISNLFLYNERADLLRSNTAVPLFRRKLSWTYHELYLNELYVRTTAECDIEALDFGAYTEKRDEIWREKVYVAN